MDAFEVALSDYMAMGSSGLKQSYGVILDEWAHQLQGIQGIKVYREMVDNSAILGGVLHGIDALIRQVKWRAEPADESPQAKAAADFLDYNIENMEHTFEDFMSNVLTNLQYGWSFFETVYKQDGRFTLWHEHAIRSQETLEKWEFDECGHLLGMYQYDPWRQNHSGNVFLPIEKCLLFTTRTNNNNPEGRSLLRSAYRSYFFAKRLQELEGIGAERDLCGLPLMEVPAKILSASATGEEVATRNLLKNIIQQVRRDEREGILMPSELDTDGKPTGYKFRLVNSGGPRQFPINEIIQRYETRQAQCLLAEFIMLGTTDSGSRALGDTKMRMFYNSLKCYLDNIQATYNRCAVKKLWRLNNLDPAIMPRYVHGEIDPPNLIELADYVSKLVGSQVIRPHEALERKLLEIGNLPEPPLDMPSMQLGIPGLGGPPPQTPEDAVIQALLGAP